MQVRISKWGNSLAVRLPKELAEKLALKEGQSVEVSIKDRTLNLRPVAQRYPTLEEMVAEAKRLGPEHEPDLVDWGPDVGAEIIDDDYSAPSRLRRRKPVE